jgi:hypothetical protein
MSDIKGVIDVFLTEVAQHYGMTMKRGASAMCHSSKLVSCRTQLEFSRRTARGDSRMTAASYKPIQV